MAVMEARAVMVYERHRRKDGVFGKVVVEDAMRPVWRVQIKLGNTHYFMSSRKYASEKSAIAAAKRLEKSYGEGR